MIQSYLYLPFFVNGGLPWKTIWASAALTWYLIVVVVITVGALQLWRYYSSRPAPAISSNLPIDDVPHVTILRPVKGLDAYLYECLAATFHQDYPQEKLTIYFCISSRSDPAFSMLQRVLADFPGFDTKILVEDEDPFLQDQLGSKAAAAMGPNPKIRNMSRGYREAKGDIIWILDCNVWVGKGAAGRMVDKLCGLHRRGGAQARRYKFVHQLPLVVHVDDEGGHVGNGGSGSGRDEVVNTHIKNDWRTWGTRSMKQPSAGAQLEEMFMSTAHAKFYTAINTVLIAPCILGKSNMFRRSHLDQLTSSDPTRPKGIDYFSHNICEDHLIGDLLWYGKVPEEKEAKREGWGKHALVYGDLAIQPMMRMSLQEYIARRIRWLRVRKFTVTLATLVEPGTESFLCSLYGAYAFATFAAGGSSTIGKFAPYWWVLFIEFWMLSVICWATVDRYLYLRLHDARSIEVDEYTPSFVLPRSTPRRKTLRGWIYAWLGREILAFPIWAWAMFGGTTVNWRGRKFWVSTDMTVHEIRHDEEEKHVLSSIDKEPRVKYS